SIKSKKVFVKKTLTLEQEDEEYLAYLSMIKEENKEYCNVSLLNLIDVEDAKTTLIFSDLLDLNFLKRTDLLPNFNTDVNFDSGKYLQDLCILGLKKRLLNNVEKKYVDRLKYELNVINKMGYNDYFLIVWDYVKYAKNNAILVGPGRGSAASSLVSYSLGITDIDPLKYDLLFERFLNQERITMPDIDIDFDAEKRHLVIEYVIKKYGVKKVAGIITFSALTPKQVIRDLSKVLNVSSYKTDNLVKNFEDKKSLIELKSNVFIKKILSGDKELNKVYDIAIHLEGLKRHTSLHAAGIIISNKDLDNYVPLIKNNDVYVCGYTMNYLEQLGLLKMDFLGLKNLTTIDKVINATENKVNFSNIPLNDNETFKLFETGNLDGIFQFETPGMRKFITALKPKKIGDLVDAVALFRPGPIDNIPTYIARKNKKEPIVYLHEDLKDILESTEGIIIYQEQIMQIASKMAGYSYGQADVLRRAMSKKKEDVLLKEEERFIKGSISKGYDKDKAKEVYALILKFANYGFPKAHSVSYAIIGYKMAYLKTHYKEIFMSELLTSSIGTVNKTLSLIKECQRLDIKINRPSINSSSYEYRVTDGKIEYSLAMIKSVGVLTCKQIIEERSKGLFKDFYDFILRMKNLDKNVIKNLALSGSFEEFGYNHKTIIKNIDTILNYADLADYSADSSVIKPEIKKYEEYSLDELSKQEKEIYGFYLANHPTNKYVDDKQVSVNLAYKYFDRSVQMILYIDSKREIETKNKEKMMFLSGSDSDGSIDLVMFPKIYNKYFNINVPGVYKVFGKVEKRFSGFQLVIYSIDILS
ncbi:MAG: DNA polymerase III subunit alpha, partial [Bacilli bacterium]